ncbi:MAG: QcrA and Rieske domain-containing protein [Gemmatimonadota bacterium]|jgi:Rieske Fe-S protein
MAEQDRPKSGSRRGFVNWLLGSSAGAFAVSALYPVVRFIVPPVEAESTTASVTLPFTPAEIAPNEGKPFRFGSRPGLLVRTPTGDLRAFSAECTHLSCTVQYRSDESRIWCACHNGVFDLNGINVQGPPPRPLDTYDVNVRGDQIVVSLKA